MFIDFSKETAKQLATVVPLNNCRVYKFTRHYVNKNGVTCQVTSLFLTCLLTLSLSVYRCVCMHVHLQYVCVFMFLKGISQRSGLCGDKRQLWEDWLENPEVKSASGWLQWKWSLVAQGVLQNLLKDLIDITTQP